MQAEGLPLGDLSVVMEVGSRALQVCSRVVCTEHETVDGENGVQFSSQGKHVEDPTAKPLSL